MSPEEERIRATGMVTGFFERAHQAKAEQAQLLERLRQPTLEERLTRLEADVQQLKEMMIEELQLLKALANG